MREKPDNVMKKHGLDFCTEAELTVIRAARKTIAIQIKGDQIIVRAPKVMRDRELVEFLRSKRSWIEKHYALARQRREAEKNVVPFTAEEIYALGQKAVAVLPDRVRHYAALLGVDYGRITIRNQRTRWGSCSSSGNLNFNCLLMLMPDEIIDSVIVHELCHRKHMDHSEAFYAEIERVFPKYQKCHEWLNQHGGDYLRRLP